MSTMVWAYLAYLAICVLITVWVARTLREHGAVFISDSGEAPTQLVKAKTHLLIVGFYLINLGVIGLALRYGGSAVSIQTAIEVLSTKIGAIVLAIGFTHFLMLAIFTGLRNGRRFAAMKPQTSN